MAEPRYSPDALVTPIESAPLGGLSTPALAARYAEAAPHLRDALRDVEALRDLAARAREMDRKAARWRRRKALGAYAEGRARHYDREAQRLDARRLTREMRAEAGGTFFDVGDRRAPTFRALVEATRTLAAGVLWDVVATGDVQHVKSSAGERMTRRPSRVSVRRLATLRPDLPAVCFENANGPGLWLYPSLVALGDRSGMPGLIALDEVELVAGAVRFVESGPPPPGAHVVEQTWRYVNKDETPDRRFSDNPELDVALYGRIEFRSARGLHEAFLSSDAPAALAFGEAFRAHQAALAEM